MNNCALLISTTSDVESVMPPSAVTVATLTSGLGSLPLTVYCSVKTYGVAGSSRRPSAGMPPMAPSSVSVMDSTV